MTAAEPLTLSTITPVYSGEKYLSELISHLHSLKLDWEDNNAPIRLIESIFVDDGSIDSSSEVLKELSLQYSWVKVITLSRNYGQHSATVSGICHSSGDWVVTLDEDLQHHPAHIPTLLQKQAKDSLDIVYANAKDKSHGNSWRDFSSSKVKSVLAKLSNTPQIKLFNSFRLIRGNIARAAASSSSSNTYLDMAISWFTKSASSVDIPMSDDRYNQEGKSGYNFLKLAGHARRLMISSQINIGAIGIFIGFITCIIAVTFASVVIVQNLFFPHTSLPAGWSSLTVLLTFFSGVIITLLCIAIEYLNTIILNQLGLPTFFVIDRDGDELLKSWFNKS
jgi:glycosyltransferase involved in cell wall biosynthesis